MSARGTVETRLADAERRIEELTRRVANVPAVQARPPGLHDDDQIPFRNDSGDTIPAYGVVAIGRDPPPSSEGVLSIGGKALAVQAYSSSQVARHRCFLINGPSDVEADAFGWGRMNSPMAYALYDTSDTPILGQVWSMDWAAAGASRFKLTLVPGDLVRAREGGFTIIGGATNGRVLVKHWPLYSYFEETTFSVGAFGVAASSAGTIIGPITIHYPGYYLVSCYVSCVVSNITIGSTVSWWKAGVALNGTTISTPAASRISIPSGFYTDKPDSVSSQCLRYLVDGDVLLLRGECGPDVSIGGTIFNATAALTATGVAVRG